MDNYAMIMINIGLMFLINGIMVIILDRIMP